MLNRTGAALLPLPARAQAAWPARNVTLIVPFDPTRDFACISQRRDHGQRAGGEPARDPARGGGAAYPRADSGANADGIRCLCGLRRDGTAALRPGDPARRHPVRLTWLRAALVGMTIEQASAKLRAHGFVPDEEDPIDRPREGETFVRSVWADGRLGLTSILVGCSAHVTATHAVIGQKGANPSEAALPSYLDLAAIPN